MPKLPDGLPPSLSTTSTPAQVGEAAPIVKPPSAKLLLLGGLLPVAAFAIVEQVYGTMGGLIAGIVFGAGEIGWEFYKLGRPQTITIASNILVIGLGAVSLFEGESSWFKLQPAIILAVFAVFLSGSALLGRPFLSELAKKQNPNLPPLVHERLKGITFRLGFFVLGIAALSVHAAFYWSTAAWATLKGVGAPLLLLLYMGIEVLWIRLTVRRKP